MNAATPGDAGDGPFVTPDDATVVAPGRGAPASGPAGGAARLPRRPATPSGWGYRSLVAQLDTSSLHRVWLQQMVDFVNARLDLSDHRMIVLLKLMLTGEDIMPEAQRESIKNAILGFRYGMQEPGRDGMCTWTENHQLIFATAEYLAGQLYPDEHFDNDHRRGSVKKAHAHARLLRWLDDRFHHGFSEWLSNTYYEIMACGLVMLVDHAEDEDLATRAAMVLDLLMLDLALHRFEGHFHASGGRVYRNQKMSATAAEVAVIVNSAFGTPTRFNHDELAGVFVAREKYRVPEVVLEIASASGARQIRTSQGRDVAEALADVQRELGDAPDEVRFTEQLYTAWGQQAYVTPETIELTLKGLGRFRLEQNRFLSPLNRFATIRSPALQRATVKALNPITQGTALHRANVFTYRTPNYLISSAQHYRPGEFGDQQHLWHAAFPGDICVFSTHPGTTQLTGEARPASPSAWVGNGVNPDIGQFNNVVLVLHDLRTRRGYLEGRRHELSHMYMPLVKFDETTVLPHVVAGRTGTSMIGVVAVERIELVSQTELVQRGLVTGWAVVASDLSEFSSLAAFVAELKKATLQRVRGGMVFTMRHINTTDTVPRPHTYRLKWRDAFTVDGVMQNHHYWRHDNDWVSAARGADRVVVEGRDRELVLEWTAGTRVEQPLTG
ncbi:hypothetical protein ACQCX5_05360 [Propionibacteriaceae bacterium G57]|uniref:hypothetical protein n=1 Tax=Aestuariimicrobium sp. G57 TaxID=3418485 RepID=UPI003DA7951C